MIPVTVLIVTKNEAKNISACLDALKRFDDVLVVDSGSKDKTIDIVTEKNIPVVSFQWNGKYPKKRQWCLDYLSLKNDWVFFVDADEIVPDALITEIDNLIKANPPEAGFFITGRYRIGGKVLRFGLPNQKIALFHRGRMEFPVVDDLDIPGMGEIEGHYQPVLKTNAAHLKIGHLKNHLIHDAMEDARAWDFRHEKYARWERGMNAKNAWPVDPIPWRQKAKQSLRRSVFRPHIMFLMGYIVKLGVLDGQNGFEMAYKRYSYLKKIKQ